MSSESLHLSGSKEFGGAAVSLALPASQARGGMKKLLALAAIITFAVWNRCFPRGGTDAAILTCSGIAASLSDEFDWESILPSETLNWVPCHDKFQCARFEVPFDYSEPHDRKAAIAMIKYPSKYPVGHKDWKGPILYNPGGPGGSGVDSVLRRGELFAKIIGDDYDHIGFDPRGIGHTTPKLDIFPSAAERKVFELQMPPPINSTSDALAKWYAYAKVLGELALEREPEVVKHLSTAVVARDMLEMTKAHGRDKLLYWGFSYGTVLGITYSSMFPDNVGRVVVDGVVDTENYYSGSWSNNLMDTDKNLQTLIDECAASSACALHESSPQKVHDRLESIFDRLRAAPIPVINGSTYGIVDWKMAHRVLFQTLYKPRDLFPPFAQAMADIERGDGAAMLDLSSSKEDSLFRCNCGSNPGLPPREQEATYAIACGEGSKVDVSLEELGQDYAKMAALSPFADTWAIHAMCSGWMARSAWSYTGPFVGNTSFPMLLVGNTADPVTPLWAAKKMSKCFKDAVVLTQNSPGHCSLAAPSVCTAKYIREYFRNGTLPAEGTMCEIDGHVFPPDGENAEKMEVQRKESISEEDRDLFDAVRELSKAFQPTRLGF